MALPSNSLTSLVTPLHTPDGRYLVVRGRLWRASNPHLSQAQKQALVEELMNARRAVKAALQIENAAALHTARQQVHHAKVALGERGAVWWNDGSPDYNRYLVKNTPYAEWYAGASGNASSTCRDLTCITAGRDIARQCISSATLLDSLCKLANECGTCWASLPPICFVHPAS